MITEPADRVGADRVEADRVLTTRELTARVRELEKQMEKLMTAPAPVPSPASQTTLLIRRRAAI